MSGMKAILFQDFIENLTLKESICVYSLRMFGHLAFGAPCSGTCQKADD